MSTPGKTAVLLLAHGSPESVEEVPDFLLRVTGGRPLPPDAIEEVKRRYQLIGRSPLTEITLKQGELLAAKLNLPVYVGMRNWRPFISQTLKRMISDRVSHAVVICLAPQNSRTSVGLYRNSLAKCTDPGLSFDFVESWHDEPSLIQAFAEKLMAGRAKANAESGAPVPVIFTAHSVPQRTILEGDPYEKQVRETAELVAAEASLETSDWRFAFQSQGMSGGAWLGATVETTILELKRSGYRGVFVQPIGFLCDHVEVLYDIDIVFKQFADSEGMRLWRAESLNHSPLLTSALEAIANSRLRARGRRDKRMKRIAIIGGGISGLSAAFRLEQRRKQGAQLEYVLFESGAHFGGVIRTERIDDCLIEAGPDSFLTEKVWAADLCRELGLAEQRIGSNDADRKTYILVNGRLVPLPDGLMFMVPTNLWATVSSPLFSWTTKLHMVREWLHRPAVSTDDITVAEFVSRHYGREMVDRIADPLLAGVYGGSADELSVRSVLPRFVEMEAKHGSLGKAMTESKARQGGSAKPLFTSLKNGMQQMTDALVSRIPESARRVNAPVEAVKPESGKWLLLSTGRTEEFDAVIVAIPAYEAGKLLAGVNSKIAQDLTSIPYSSSVTVTLGYGENVRAALPHGFGFLVPRTENVRIIAATFVHNKFPSRVPDNQALIRCFLGGTRDESILNASEGEIEDIVRRDLGTILRIRTQPTFYRVYKWKQAMAQYTVGHGARVERIRAQLADMRGLALAGNAYGGIGVPDCIRSGSEAATKVVTDLTPLE